MSSMAGVRRALAADPADSEAAERHLATLTARLRLQPDCVAPADLAELAALVRRRPEPEPAVLAETLRCLRNAAAVSDPHRGQLAADGRLLRQLAQLLRRPQLVVPARCAVQLLGNVVSAGGGAQAAVWSCVADLLPQLLASTDRKLAAYTSMVLFNSLKANRAVTASLLARDDLDAVLGALLTLVSDDDCEFALFAVEEVLAADFGRLYGCVSPALLPVLLDIALAGSERRTLTLSADAALFVKRCFLERSAPLLKLDAAALATADPAHLKKLLELLGVLSAEEELRPQLQDDPALLEAVVNLLRVVHELGKEEGTAFSTLGKLSDMEVDGADGPDTVTAGPAFGMKAHLVRLTGNLVWRCAEAQQAARRLRVMPTVLECCNLDARNPLLQQWAVAAIRYLCEHCPENQAEIRHMDLQGMAPAAAQELQQVGITVVPEAGRLRVRSTPRQQ